MNLQGSNHSSLVIGMEPLRRGRIDPGQFGMQSCGSMLQRKLFPFPAEVPVCGGTFKDASQKRTQVEASPTDKQRHPVSFQDSVTRFERRS